MRFLADENMPGPAVAALRDLGHDVLWIKELMPGAEDPVVLALAQREARVVVTADTDFGELAFRSGLPAQCGIVLVRLDWTDPETDNRTVVHRPGFARRLVRDLRRRRKRSGAPQTTCLRQDLTPTAEVNPVDTPRQEEERQILSANSTIPGSNADHFGEFSARHRPSAVFA